MQLRSRKAFIKNIKPEAFRRPSSYSCSEVEGSAKKDAKGTVATPHKDAKGVVLVGYRKRPDPDEIPAAGVELGTLSPAQGTSHSDLSCAQYSVNSVSMPSLFVKSCWNRGSVNSLPDLNDLAGTRSDTSILQTHDSVVENDADDTLAHTARTRFKAHRSHTEPIPDFVSGHKVSSRSPDSDMAESSLECKADSESTDPVHSTCKTLAFEKEDYDALANCISDSLGETEVNYVINPEVDDDVSDDETHIANGYDEFLESHCGSQARVNASTTSMDGSNVPSQQVSQQDVQISISDGGLGPPGNGEGKRDSISENTENKLTVLELLKEEYAKSHPGDKIKLSEENLHKIEVSNRGPFACQRASSDTDLIKNIEEEQRRECNKNCSMALRNADGLQKSRARLLSSSSSYPELSQRYADSTAPKLVSVIGHNTVK